MYEYIPKTRAELFLFKYKSPICSNKNKKTALFVYAESDENKTKQKAIYEENLSEENLSLIRWYSVIHIRNSGEFFLNLNMHYYIEWEVSAIKKCYLDRW